jgi:ribosomal-protein-alanine N-acetyltransferase
MLCKIAFNADPGCGHLDPALHLAQFRRGGPGRARGPDGEPDFMRFSTKGPFTREQTASFLFDRVIAPAHAGLPSLFALIWRGDDRLLGYCGFLNQMVDGVEEIEIGYRIHPDYWNRGIATEAARAVRDHAFNVLKLERVISLIHPENHPSRRVTEKNGMTLEKRTVFHGFPVLVFSATHSCAER